MTNFEYYIKGGKADEGWNVFTTNYYSKGTGRAIDRYNKWLLEEHKEPILDDVEKEYLSNVIKPFRNRVSSIIKSEDNDGYYIEIALIDDIDYVFLPYFKASTKMYTGMKLNRRYTLKELNL